MNRFALVLVPVLAACALAAVPDTANGCAAAPRRGEHVYTNDESALIVWDDKTKTEHFIRRANFRTTGYDFGFLVPTPNKPDLDVADDSLFGELAVLTVPKIEYREVTREVEKDFLPGCMPKAASDATAEKSMATGRAGAPGGVEVLEQKRVGDYDATVLAFRKGDGDTPEAGAAELEKWLIKHGFETPGTVREWLKKYVADQWCITAFKIVNAAPRKDDAKVGGPKPPEPPSPQRNLRAKPIRMSFKTERPFYPYREPTTEPNANPQGESRLLRVFVASQSRFAGKLGDGAKPWPGQTVWSGPVDEKHWASIFSHATLTEPPLKDGKPVFEKPGTAGLWLTEYEDKSSPRPGTDEVYFEPSADQTPIERPPNIITKTRIVTVTPWWHLAVYIGIPVLFAVGGILVWRLFARSA